VTGCGQEKGESSAPNVVTNGSFEQQTIGYGNYVNLSTGSTQMQSTLRV